MVYLVYTTNDRIMEEFGPVYGVSIVDDMAIRIDRPLQGYKEGNRYRLLDSRKGTSVAISPVSVTAQSGKVVMTTSRNTYIFRPA